MLRPASTLPLFPSTTLFRSGRGCRPGEWAFGTERLARLVVFAAGVAVLVIFARLRRRRRRRSRSGHSLDADSRDRKSTRLNSSHTVISYAVFCLKKQMGTAR